MKLIKAGINDAETVFLIVKATVDEVFTRCYNRETADFFIKIHSLNNILEDIKNNSVYLIEKDGEYIGTGTVKKDYITRVYILPRYEHMGAGTYIMDILEREVFKNYPAVFVDPSVIALPFYEKRGYALTEHEEFYLSRSNLLVHDTYKKTAP